MNANATTNSGIGGSVRRREDSRFLQGCGKYTDDINIAGQTYAVFVRSPHAHARINGIDTAAAAAAEGVAAVFTAEHTKDIGGVPTGWQVHSKDGEPMAEPKHPVLAEGAARHVGDPVAMVIAATRRQARDAAELVTVDYDPQPAAVDMKAALADGAAKVHGDLPGNLCYDWELGDKAAVDEAFAGAAHVTKLDLVNNRLIPNAVEPRCAIGDYDSVSGEHTLYTTSQNPHVIRLLIAGQHGRLPLHFRAVHSHLPARHAARRPVCDAGDLLRGEGGVHQHRAGGRLPRRRPAGGHVYSGAHRGPGGGRDRGGPGRVAPPQHDSAGAVSVPDAGGAAVRHRQLRGDPGPGPQGRRLRRF